ncbi:two component regulator with propeller domain [Edaphobacter modestus]|uniref:Two component regulator with propeller domain n=2 Tax=Edaphobacter modestus TaxID=388466 RepID=A0A4Q7YFQ9_9BACT|nr:two component regulator with propeller domain [Edaphobacter modestus]
MSSGGHEIISPLVYRLLLCVFLSLSFCQPIFGLNPDWRLSQYAHSVWRTQDGLFEGTPTAITQTTDGYIWLGTQSGLFRFDGVRFVRWVPPNGKDLPSPEITALFGASNGSLWIGTSEGLAHWQNGNLRYPKVRGFIDAILEDHKGVIWTVRTRIRNVGPLCRVTENIVRCYGTADGIPMPHAGALIQDDQGGFWLGSDTTLLHWRAGHSESYIQPGLSAAKGLAGVQAIAKNANGDLWMGMVVNGPGLGLQQLSNGVIKPFVTRELDGSTLNVNVLTPTRGDGLIVGTQGQGIYRIQGGKVDHFSVAQGLSSDTINSIFEDREGDLWVATGKGLDCFSNRTVLSFSSQEGLSADRVNSVFASSDGTIWIGNRYGLDFIRGGKVSSIRAKDGLPGTRVTSLLEQRPGLLWVGVDNGLWIYEGGKFRAVRRPDGTPTGVIVAMVQDVDGSLWTEALGSPKNILHIQGRAITEEISVSTGGFSIAADPHGGVWIGQGRAKVALYQKEHLDIVQLSATAKGATTDLSIDSRGWLLAAVYDVGIIGRRNGVVQALTEKNGLPCEGMYNLSRDLNGALWLSTMCGLIQISKEEIERWWVDPETKIKFRTFDALDGAETGQALFGPGVTRSPDGQLWFANQTSLQMIDPAHLNVNSIPPPVHIEEIIADRKRYLPVKGLRLPALTRDLEIDYTGLSFVTPKKVAFRYKLEGHDTDWQEIGARRQAFYTDLPPGNYRFHVAASNGVGLWNEVGDTIDFSIAPTLYQTMWFRILCILAAVVALWLFYLIRLKQATAQIQERLDARLEERERIARDLHDTLLQGFQGLMLRFQAVMKTLPADGTSRKMFENVMERADEVLLEGRESVRNLREDGIPDGQLSEALAGCGEELAQDHHAAFNLSVSGTPKVLDPVFFNELYLIAREALFNAFKHSRATKIEVEVIYDSARLSLRIRDDGIGMSQQILTEGKTGHWGLLGMRERTQKIGGQIKLWSNADVGTEIEVTIPSQIAYRDYRKKTFWIRVKEISRKLRGINL